MFFVTRRATVLVPSGTPQQPDLKHLFILLNDPVTLARLVLLVSISRVKQGRPHDPACLLYPGDHPFITQNSYVVYRKARIEEAVKIERGVQGQILVPREAMDGGVFARICEGVLNSRHTEPAIKSFFEPIWRRSAGS
ncbi:hypothetical protein [Pseudomonas subflava]|uniref:hypothetical protein n=1 Tax=Pseudomonas subflava TaxID=2952933 RepID=UPI0020798940|nr:hypothetical protein [Pseudomonas subflava]